MEVFMETELVKAIYVKPNGVYLNCKWKDDNAPYHQRKSDRLTEAYTCNGQKGLDIEFVQMLFWRLGEIRGNHPSVARFRPCIEKARKLYHEAQMEIDNKYTELALNDEMLRVPDEIRSDEAKVYQEFHQITMRNLFERIADLADPPPQDRKRNDRAR
jgi:hypothetical protein